MKYQDVLWIFRRFTHFNITSKKVKDFGTPNNFDTEYTEHQHITDTKQPYRHANKRDPLPQMIKHVQRRMVLKNKQLYLESLRPPNLVHRSLHRCFLGSRVKDCPIQISSASSKYLLIDLELYLRTFLHNRLYLDGEGVHHRVKKRKLPELDDPQVTVVKIYCLLNISDELNFSDAFLHRSSSTKLLTSMYLISWKRIISFAKFIGV